MRHRKPHLEVREEDVIEKTPGDAVLKALVRAEQWNALLKLLDRNEAYFVGWYLANGKAQGEQKPAADAIGMSYPWATGVWKRIVAKAQQLRDQQEP